MGLTQDLRGVPKMIMSLFRCLAVEAPALCAAVCHEGVPRFDADSNPCRFKDVGWHDAGLPKGPDGRVQANIASESLPHLDAGYTRR